MKKKGNKKLAQWLTAISTIGLATSTVALLEIDFWAWCLIILSPLILGLIIGPVIFFVWKKKRSKDYTSNPSKSRVDSFIKNRK